MAAYLFVQIRVLHQEGWVNYRARVGPLAARFGGQYLVRGAGKLDVLEGSHDGSSLVVFEFPAMQAIHDFWSSAEYAEVKTLRQGAAELDVWAVPGVESFPSAVT